MRGALHGHEEFCPWRLAGILSATPFDKNLRQFRYLFIKEGSGRYMPKAWYFLSTHSPAVSVSFGNQDGRKVENFDIVRKSILDPKALLFWRKTSSQKGFQRQRLCERSGLGFTWLFPTNPPPCVPWWQHVGGKTSPWKACPQLHSSEGSGSVLTEQAISASFRPYLAPQPVKKPLQMPIFSSKYS